jgi:hypothetical protein
MHNSTCTTMPKCCQAATSHERTYAAKTQDPKHPHLFHQRAVILHRQRFAIPRWPCTFITARARFGHLSNGDLGPGSANASRVHCGKATVRHGAFVTSVSWIGNSAPWCMHHACIVGRQQCAMVQPETGVSAPARNKQVSCNCMI